MERASDAAQAGARGRVALLAQAQVAAWVRQRERRIAGPSWFYRLGRKRERIKISFFFSSNC